MDETDRKRNGTNHPPTQHWIFYDLFQKIKNDGNMMDEENKTHTDEFNKSKIIRTENADLCFYWFLIVTTLICAILFLVTQQKFETKNSEKHDLTKDYSFQVFA